MNMKKRAAMIAQLVRTTLIELRLYTVCTYGTLSAGDVRVEPMSKVIYF